MVCNGCTFTCKLQKQIALKLELCFMFCTEAEPEKFTVGMLEGPFRIGQPFQIPLVFRDAYNNITKPVYTSTPTIQARYN